MGFENTSSSYISLTSSVPKILVVWQTSISSGGTHTIPFRSMPYQETMGSHFHLSGEKFTQSTRFQQMLCGCVLPLALFLDYPSWSLMWFSQPLYR
jgi:hypothetical protein